MTQRLSPVLVPAGAARRHVSVMFKSLGPYHVARLRAAAAHLDLSAIELYGVDDTYGWEPVRRTQGFERRTLLPGATRVGRRALWRLVRRELDRVDPEVVAIPGWATAYALAGQAWALSRKRGTVLLSESSAADAPRTRWKEMVKSAIVRPHGAALVGGAPQRAYLRRLGFPEERVFEGYDVVDNDYFSSRADAVRNDASAERHRQGLPERYFLSSARFVPRKNLVTVLSAYARYRSAATGGAWGLVLLGDGPQRAELERLVGTLGIRESVLFPGFRQYDDLPLYYGLAGAFVHASCVEPWGLVVNEAMASGLPVLVSRSCGCAIDLIHEARNGFTFDSRDVGALSALLGRVAGDPAEAARMGGASREIVHEWSPQKFAHGLTMAVEASARRRNMNPWTIRALVSAAFVRSRHLA